MFPHFNSNPFLFSWTFLMAYKVKVSLRLTKHDATKMYLLFN